MKNVSRVGIDIFRSVLQLHGVDKEGKVVLHKRLLRDEIKEIIWHLPECEIGTARALSSNFFKLGERGRKLEA